MDKNIFSVIQNSLNGLVINDENNSISYNTSEISSFAEYMPSLDELNDINNNPDDDIFKYNTSKCVLLILDNGNEITLKEYKKGMNPVLVKIMNYDLDYTHNEIILAFKDNYMIKEEITPWALYNIKFDRQTKIYNKDDESSVKRYEMDFDGYTHTRNVIKTTKYRKEMLDVVPAFYYAISQNVMAGKTKYTGYIPAIGQLKILYNYLDLLYTITNTIFPRTIFWLPEFNLWSSTEVDQYQIWVMSKGKVRAFDKCSKLCVLPFFKK